MVISPLSIMGCMYMLAAGTAGETRIEILSTLGFANIFGGNGNNAIDKPFEEGLTYEFLLPFYSYFAVVLTQLWSKSETFRKFDIFDFYFEN